ncbi:hypothetical protein BT69DRAFT_1290123 [Atractiella rhizophila]|nr:hypothetical protein BT69DRAFT_1290123 [Atractiella rhizophila]
MGDVKKKVYGTPSPAASPSPRGEKQFALQQQYQQVSAQRRSPREFQAFALRGTRAGDGKR